MTKKEQEAFDNLNGEFNALKAEHEKQQQIIQEYANLINVKSQLVTDLDRIAEIRNQQIQSLQNSKAYYVTGEDVRELYEQAYQSMDDEDEGIKLTRDLNKLNDSLPGITLEFIFERSETGKVKLMSPAFHPSNI